ncbi:YecR family lipoprotein [Pseudomonas sp. RTB3]
MNTRLIIVLATAIALAGCAEPRKDIYALDGSRANGLLDIAFQGGAVYDAGDMSKALTIATQKCIAWGYQGAEKFGSKRTFCLEGNMFGCQASEQTVKFQCVGSPDRGQYGALVPFDSSAGQQQTAPSKQVQLDRLSSENMSYEEYQRRYKAISSQPNF